MTSNDAITAAPWAAVSWFVARPIDTTAAGTPSWADATSPIDSGSRQTSPAPRWMAIEAAASTPARASERRRIQQGTEIDLGAEVDEEQGDRKAFADPDQLLGDPARLTEQGDDHSDDEPGDQDSTCRTDGQSTRR